MVRKFSIWLNDVHFYRRAVQQGFIGFWAQAMRRKFCKETLVVELKPATKVSKSHIAQTASYLKLSGWHKGVVIKILYLEADELEIGIVEI